MSKPELSHINTKGEAQMVDVGSKPVTQREATAEGLITMAPSTLNLIDTASVKKGDVIATARIAGIQAAKATSALIPLCHPLPLTHVRLDFISHADTSSIQVRATARTQGQTGVEMEALTAVSVALLTIYDMCKAVQRDMVISQIRLSEKSGGASGHYVLT